MRSRSGTDDDHFYYVDLDACAFPDADVWRRVPQFDSPIVRVDEQRTVRIHRAGCQCNESTRSMRQRRVSVHHRAEWRTVRLNRFEVNVVRHVQLDNECDMRVPRRVLLSVLQRAV